MYNKYIINETGFYGEHMGRIYILVEMQLNDDN
jgi:hypothetical protein